MDGEQTTQPLAATVEEEISTKATRKGQFCRSLQTIIFSAVRPECYAVYIDYVKDCFLRHTCVCGVFSVAQRRSVTLNALFLCGGTSVFGLVQSLFLTCAADLAMARVQDRFG